MKGITEDGHVISGLSGSKGIAIGDVCVLDRKKRTVSPTPIKKNQAARNLKKFTEARAALTEELRLLEESLDDKDSAEIIDTQLEIIADPEIERKVTGIVNEKLLSVDFAVYQTFCGFIERLKESGSELFRQRIIDLEDIRDRLVDLLCEYDQKKSIKKGAIVFTAELSPAELVSYFDNGIGGLVMDKGGVTSHAAIIAQSLGIPCVVSSKTAVRDARNHKRAVIDGFEGKVILDPGEEDVKWYRSQIRKQKRKKQRVADTVNESKDGISFTLQANIEFEAELEGISRSSASGIGLLRTESLLFRKKNLRHEQEQIRFYTKILSEVPGQITIRLFDVGGDKGNVRAVQEANPFLGWRGVRMLLDEKEVLHTQLAAILKVAGKFPERVRVLVPMVSVIEEFRAVRSTMEDIQGALISSGQPVDEKVPLGLMVEVPSVALSADKFAAEADFFSIGTNDLTQYTLAVDRGNEQICSLFQHYHPSVLQLIQLTAAASETAGIPLSVCGELAGNNVGAAVLFGMGIRDFSMVTHSIPAVKALLSSGSLKTFSTLAEEALKVSTAREVENLFNEMISNR